MAVVFQHSEDEAAIQPAEAVTQEERHTHVDSVNQGEVLQQTSPDKTLARNAIGNVQMCCVDHNR